MAANDLYEVIIVLPPQAAWPTLAGLDTAARISQFRARVATDDPADDRPAWAELADPVGLVRELQPRLSKEVISSLAAAVTNGCGLAELRFVPEAALPVISEALGRVVLLDGSARRAYYRSIPARDLPLGLAFPERGTGLEVHGGISPVVAADVAPDNSMIATTDQASTTLWRPDTGEEVRSVEAGGFEVSFVLGGSAVRIARFDNQGFVDAATGELLSEQPADGKVSPVGALLAAVRQGRVAVTDLRGRELWQAPGERFAWAGDDRLFVSARASGSTTGHDARSGAALIRLPGHAPVAAPDGQTVITTEDGQLAIWDARTGELRTRLAGIAIDPDPWAGQSSVVAYDPAVRAVIVRDRHNALLVVDSLTGEVNFSVDGYAADLFSAAGVVLTSGVAYDAFSGHELYRHELYRTVPRDVVSDPAGRSIAMGLAGGPTQVLDARSGRVRFDAAGAPLRFDRTGSLLVTALGDGRAALYDARSGGLLASLGTMRVLSLLKAPERIAAGAYAGSFVEYESKGIFELAPERAVPEVEYVSRYVVVTGPDAVTPELAFDVHAALVRDRPADLPQSSPVKLRPTHDEAGAPTGAPAVSFALYATPAFTMLSQSNVSIELRPDSDPEPVTFRLVAAAGASGPQEISVVLWQGWLLIGRVKLIIKLEADAASSPPKLVRRSLTVPPPGEQAQAPEVAIYVSRVSAGGRDTLHYSYEWPARGWPRVQAGSVELLTTADRWLADKFQQLSAAARRPVGDTGTLDSGGEPAGREFERIGENLYSQLFTDELSDFYAKFAGDTKNLLIFSDEPWIPWELVKPWGGGIDGDFLCAQFDLSRWYYSRSCRVPKADLVVREVAPIIPQSDLVATLEEARFFQRLPGRWPSVSLHWPLPVRRGQVLEILAGGLTQLLHFAAHGSLRDEGGVAAIELTDGLLRAEDIVGNQVESGLRAATPVVFMNACHSGRQVIGLTRPDGWVERCLDLGCRGFLGANWEVNDQLAAEFAIEVYNRLVDRSPIAAAVRAARQLVRGQDPANPTWLSYSLYAHPKMTLLAAGSSAR